MNLSWMEHLVFTMEKDSDISTSKHFKEKYINFNIRHSEVYKAIVNYHIEKYGNSFNSRYTYHTKEDLKKLKEKAQRRASYRRNRGK